MRAYNIYYKNGKVNKRPLSKEAVTSILNMPFIYKRISDHEDLKILTKQLKVVECIIV